MQRKVYLFSTESREKFDEIKFYLSFFRTRVHFGVAKVQISERNANEKLFFLFVLHFHGQYVVAHTDNMFSVSDEDNGLLGTGGQQPLEKLTLRLTVEC